MDANSLKANAWLAEVMADEENLKAIREGDPEAVRRTLEDLLAAQVVRRAAGK